MKIKELKIKNLRKISDANLIFDKPLICLYGEVQQGKTTFLDAIKILFSSGFPNDLIQHGQTEASIDLLLENGSINRSFYIDKTGQTKGRPLVAIVENKKLKASDLKALFNPFQLNQDFLKEMTGLERKKFFVELFNVDTAAIDAEILKKEQIAKDLRIEIKGIGDIDLTEVKKPDLEKLQQKEQFEKEKLNKVVLQNRRKNAELKMKWQIENNKHFAEIQAYNQLQVEIKAQIEHKKTALSELEAVIEKYDVASYVLIDELSEFIENMKQPKNQKALTSLPEPIYIDEKQGCDTAELEKIQAEISDAKVNNLRYENYLKNIKKNNAKTQKESDLKLAESDIRALRTQKIAKLSEYGKEIAGLEFNENGDLIFEGIANDNLSTSQIVRLGSLLSKLYPDSLLDLELIDRAESLGKKIWEFIDKAEKEKKTILAAIVGEKPAKVPENVGVYIVENGKFI